MTLTYAHLYFALFGVLIGIGLGFWNLFVWLCYKAEEKARANDE